MQEALKATFPEFYSKAQLINYYVSFDFPEKQMKMVSWWQRVIEFIIQVLPSPLSTNDRSTSPTRNSLPTSLFTISNPSPSPPSSITSHIITILPHSTSTRHGWPSRRKP